MDFVQPRSAADMPIEKKNTLLMAFCVALLYEKSFEGKIGKALRSLADEAHKGHEGNLMECKNELCKQASELLCECKAAEANFYLHDLSDLKDYQLRTSSPILGVLHINIEQGAKLNLIQV